MFLGKTESRDVAFLFSSVNSTSCLLAGNDTNDKCPSILAFPSCLKSCARLTSPTLLWLPTTEGSVVLHLEWPMSMDKESFGGLFCKPDLNTEVVGVVSPSD